ncbi:hypothetical protein SCHPADRAFT_982603 [Schizopora paradoxa]|uniref:Uncharacterized protein n=1 Tax=Schizopora paradoxa TaxID=27342 RepID=A0A0H2R8F4_9AGAM|nr:hypothetical protein SCHPADRAFT_982603 [Schizopora paradoxa]
MCLRETLQPTRAVIAGNYVDATYARKEMQCPLVAIAQFDAIHLRKDCVVNREYVLAKRGETIGEGAARPKNEREERGGTVMGTTTCLSKGQLKSNHHRLYELHPRPTNTRVELKMCDAGPSTAPPIRGEVFLIELDSERQGMKRFHWDLPSNLSMTLASVRALMLKEVRKVNTLL